MKTRWKILTAVIFVAVVLGLGWQGNRRQFDVAWDGPRVQNDWAIARVQPVRQNDDYVWERGPMMLWRIPLPFPHEGPRRAGGSKRKDGSLLPEQDIGLWLMPPASPSLRGASWASSRDGSTRHLYAATATASTGDTFALNWQAKDNGHRLLAVIPHGWPDSCRWIDVSIRDAGGKSARWRLTHLPAATREVEPAASGQNTATVLGATVKLSAFPQPPLSGEGAYIETFVQTRPDPASAYTIRFGTGKLEWGGDGQEEDFNGSTSLAKGTIMPPGRWAGVGFPAFTPWARHNHWVSKVVKVQRQETFKETVTLRGLTLRRTVRSGFRPDTALILDGPPQTFTTPSGIKISLDSDAARRSETFLMPTDALLGLQLAPSKKDGLLFLPGSPLCRRFRKSVNLSVSIPGQQTSSEMGDGKLWIQMPRAAVAGKSSLTVTIEQRATLDEATVTLTAPVSAIPPREFR